MYIEVESGFLSYLKFVYHNMVFLYLLFYQLASKYLLNAYCVSGNNLVGNANDYID